MKPAFQAHLALESFLDFRLISGLENALALHRRISAGSEVGLRREGAVVGRALTGVP